MTDEIVTRAELETARTAADFLPWVLSALERFRSKPLRIQAREGKHFVPELTEELFPIGVFASGYYCDSTQVIVQYVHGDQNYDAFVEDKRESPGPVRFIEVTLADRDYHDSLRMELLNRDGHAPSYGPIVAKGSRGRRTELSGELVAVEHTLLRAEHLQRVIDAVARKAKKQYPPGTALVVKVDDAGPFREDEDKAVLADLVSSQLLQLVANREFVVLSLVGGMGMCQTRAL